MADMTGRVMVGETMAMVGEAVVEVDMVVMDTGETAAAEEGVEAEVMVEEVDRRSANRMCVMYSKS